MCSPIRSKEWRRGLCFDSSSPANPTHPDAPTFPIHSFVSEAAGIVPTARIERPPLHRGSSASKKGTSPLLPIPPSSLASLSWNGTRVGPTAAVERVYRWSFRACLFSLQGWGLIDLPLRASNEGSPRPRVARAQKIIRLHPLPALRARRMVWRLPIPPFLGRAFREHRRSSGGRPGCPSHAGSCLITASFLWCLARVSSTRPG